MALLHSIRSSPTYLYIKCYLICTLVTLFAARPVSSRLKSGGYWAWYESTEGGHGATSWGRMQAMLTNTTRRSDGGRATESGAVNVAQEEGAPSPWWQERRFPYLFPPPQFPLNLPPPVRLASVSWLQRWRWRWHDLSQLRVQVEQDSKDTEAFPELEWDAKVRCSPDLHPDEVDFIAKRRRLISSEGNNALAKYLQLPQDTYVHPDDVPLIAIGGSGGGYRAMFGYAGFIKEAENTGLWQCTTWVSGVSGSCWTIAAHYTIASCSTDVLIAHLLAMAHEEAHPMSIQAMDRVARSQCGIYYLLGPLLRKSRGKSVACRIMDFYATLVLSYQFLPRPLALFGTEYSYNGPRMQRSASIDHSDPPKGVDYEPSEGLSRKSFQWSKVWGRAKLNEAQAPLPILTGVRRVWRPRPKKSKNESAPAGACPPEPHPVAVANNTVLQPEAYEPKTLVGSGYDWYEITPLELGSRNVGAWIPTWSYGRRFENGRSTQRQPEVSLSMVVGQCTGAPAGPLTAYISTMLASIPEGTVMSTLLSWVNEFVKMKRWEKRWGNPIRAADEPNPFYGHGMDNRVITIPSESKNDTVQHDPPAALDALRCPTSMVDQPYAAEPVTEEPAEMNNALVSEGLSTGHGDQPAPSLFQPSAALAAPIVASAPAAPTTTELAQGSVSQAGSASAMHHAEQDEIHGQPHQRNDDPDMHMSTLWSRLSHITIPRLSEVQMPHMPRLGDISLENPLRLQRNQSDESITSSMSNYDPEAFMAPMEDMSTSASTEGVPPTDGGPAPRHEWSWEHSKRLRLMDSGLSNNLPNHVLAREERHADVLISFDSSSDVKMGAAVERIHEFASDCGLDIQIHPDTKASNERSKEAAAANEAHDKARKEGNATTPQPEQSGEDEAERIRDEYEPRTAQRFNGWRLRKGKPEGRDPDVRLVYCPLFPNAVQPGYDPTTARYSTSYNLIWTADQVRALLRTAMANVEEGSKGAEVIRTTVREAYEARRAARLAREAFI